MGSAASNGLSNLGHHRTISAASDSLGRPQQPRMASDNLCSLSDLGQPRTASDGLSGLGWPQGVRRPETTSVTSDDLSNLRFD